MAEKAPDVSFLRADGSQVKLSSLIGQKTLVLFFYPKDHTAGCTAEACSFRDSYEDFKKAGADVIGISADDAASHESFKEKHRLPFMLLTDKGAAEAAFGIKKTFLGLVKGRVTFVIDRKGEIRHRFESQVQVKKHVSEALEIVRKLENEATPSAA
jgi:thioredoxin-dependent peroxiredoxin